MPVLSIITTCKNRLEHLKQSLPLMVRQDADCIVVDYGCPENCGAWVAGSFPGVQVVRVEDVSGFNAGRARNLGAQAARSPWLAFVDADVLLAPQFSATILPRLIADHYFRPDPVSLDIWGSFVVSARNFADIGGYDETLTAWGGEDDDVYWRLRTLLGATAASFDATLMTAIEHSDAERIRNSGDPERWIGYRANLLYLHIKYDLMRLLGQRDLPADLRSEIHDVVRQTVVADEQQGAVTSRISLSLPAIRADNFPQGCRLNRQWIYELERSSASSGFASPIPSQATQTL